MIVSTTNSLEGYRITDYGQLVSGETVAGINALKDLAATFRNFVGGRSQSYEEEVSRARNSAITEMIERAAQLGADAVVGVCFDYTALGADGSMLMVNCTGTAVKIAPAA